MDRIRWTSLIVILLSLLHVDGGRRGPLSRAIKWLQECVSKDDDEWYLRVPALYSIGQLAWLENNKDLEDLTRLVSNGHVKPELEPAMAAFLLEIGRDCGQLPVKRVLDKKQDFGDGECRFGTRANEASVAAYLLYLKDSKQYSVEIQGCNKWLSKAYTGTHDGNIIWDDSYGGTAYIVINWCKSGVVRGDTTLNELAAAALRTIQPTASGFSPPDTKRPAHVSSSEIYTTALALRAYLEYARSQPALLASLCGELLALWYSLGVLTRALTTAKRHSRFIVFGTAVVVLPYLGPRLYGVPVIRDIVNGTLGPFFYEILKRLLSFLS